VGDTLEEEYTKFMEILNEIVTKINSDYYKDIVDLTEFIEIKKNEMEQFHKKRLSKETKYIDKLVKELK